jgi:hypothetical protein
MTPGAQQALRRTMEIHSSTTRFAFACNQSNKIIEPLQSRCAILRYARLTDLQVVKRIVQICEAEKVEFSEDGIAALVFSAEGDMRQAINNLQSTWAGFGFVSGDNVFRVVDSPHPIKIQAMIKACWEGKVDAALEILNELWYVMPFSLSHVGALLNINLQEFGLFIPRYHQHYVPRYQDHSNFVRTCKTGIHQGNRIYTYADFRWRSDIAAVEWMRCETLQD